MEKLEKTIISGMMAVIGVAMLATVVQAAVPQPQYTCPICGAQFMSYDELSQHFISEHPTEPIEIIWE